MSRLEFRAWDTKKRIMLDVDTLAWLNGGLHFQDQATTNGWVTVAEGFKEKNESTIILMQYTGLKIKGVKVFDEDILTYSYSQPAAVARFRVFWNDYDLSWGVFTTNSNPPTERLSWFEKAEVTDDMEIIGNMYKNPRLLKGAKK